ncbi:MAG: hypothetical protein ACK4S4_15765 [Pyrinomonadaceae bacterium]
MANIYFHQEFPDRYRDELTGLIREFELMLPLWVQRVEVRLQEPEAGDWASMSLLKEYRRVNLFIDTELFAQTRDYQREVVLHEINHCFNAQPGDVAHEILALLIPNGPETQDEAARQLFQVLKTRISEAVESANTDLTYSVLRFADHLNGRRPDSFEDSF